MQPSGGLRSSRGFGYSIKHPKERKETMLLLHSKTALTTALCAVAFFQLGLAQVAPPTILQVDVENLVSYFEDTSDLSKFATDPNATTTVQPKNFHFRVSIADIVAING